MYVALASINYFTCSVSLEYRDGGQVWKVVKKETLPAPSPPTKSIHVPVRRLTGWDAETYLRRSPALHGWQEVSPAVLPAWGWDVPGVGVGRDGLARG